MNIGVRANNITNGTVVTWFVTVQNPANATSCDVTLGPDGLYFICPGPNGDPTGARTTLIPGGTTLQPGYGLETFEIQCLVNVNPGVRTAEGKVVAPGSVVHKNPLQDDPANVDKTISLNLWQPCLSLRSQCISAVNASGSLVTVTYSGTLTNCGNIFIENLMVYADQPNAGTPVFGPITLAAGATTNFTASYTTANLCGPFTTVLNAEGTSPLDTPVRSAASASSVCSISYSPAITVTKLCPQGPVQPGGVLAISGVVSNAGNIALTNVMVLNSQPAANTILLGPITLGVGQTAAYTGSYTVPVDSCGPYADTVRAQGTAVCGTQAVSASATASCPGANSPAIRVTRSCAATPVTPGGTLTYTGTVTNTGNITLTDVVVVSSVPTAATRVFGPVTLAPGAGATFTASYAVPANSCGPYPGTLTATGRDKCFATTVTDSATTECQGTSTPGIKVTKACPAGAVQPGGNLSYTGTVQNTGNIGLTNVTVLNGTRVIYGPASLAAGATASFADSYAVPTDSCGPYSDTLVATGFSQCGIPVDNSVTVSCPGTNSPSIRVTRACTGDPVQPGGTVTYSGTVTNTGNITLEDVVVVSSQPTTGTTVFGPVTLAPGQGAAFAGSYSIPSDSCGPYADTLTATGKDKCFAKVVTSSASGACPGSNLPGIVITQACPERPTPLGGTLTFTATVVNTGNITLTNVVVLNDRPAANTTVFRAAALAPGQSTNFAGSFAVSGTLDSCSIANTLRVTANNKCSGLVSSNSVTTTCPLISAPAIRVAKVCPTTPTVTGALLTFTGFVTNTGNTSLTNVVVALAGPSSATVFSTNVLAPRAVARFTASYQTPVDACSVTDTLTATGTDLCGNMVLDTTTTTCPLTSTPGLAITRACPETATLPGQELVFTGWLTNTGNITLTNVTIVVDRPVANTLFYGPVVLTPGQAAGFFGSFVVPTNVGGCSISYNLAARGQSQCTGAAVAANTAATCPVVTTPRIVVTKTCPPNPVPQGGTLVFTGNVLNAGNVTLTNIVVVNDMPAANTVVFRGISLQPGQSTNFTGSYTVPGNCCTVVDTLQARGYDICTGVGVTNTSSALCPVLFTARVKITKTCPTLTSPLKTGDVLTYSGTISNSGNITLTGVVVYNSVAGETQPVLELVGLAPGETVPYTASYTVGQDFCGTDTVTVRAVSLCGDVTVTDSATATCLVTTAPAIMVTRTCPPVVRHNEPVTFTATVLNTGNVTLTNVTVVNSMPAANTPVLGPIQLAPGEATNFVFTYTAPADCNCCELVDTLVARGQELCSGRAVTMSSTSVCRYETHPRIMVTLDCPESGAASGQTVAYSGTVMNMGDIALTNVIVVSSLPGENTQVFGPITLARGEAREFLASYTRGDTTPPVSAMRLTATGVDPCNRLTVTGEDNCLGNLVTTPPTLMRPVFNANSVALTWSAVNGVTYRVQASSNLVAWDNVAGDVIAQGSTASKDVPVGAEVQRFYRIMIVP